MRVSKVVILVAALLLAAPWFCDSQLRAQPLTTPVNVTPDCLIFFDFTADASSAQFDNRFIGCKTWYVAYTNTGFPALTLTFQSAPDAGGVPGVWAGFAGAVLEGVNPNVAVTQASTIMYGYFPWQRITLTGSVAGAGRRIRGTFYGYRQTPVTSIVFPAGATVTADQGEPNNDAHRWPVYLSDGVNPQGTATNPLAQSPYLWNGAAWVVQPVCNLSAPFTIAGAGTVELVALTAAQRIRVCHVSFSVSGATNATFIEGTGAACAGAPANLSGAYTNILGLALDLGDRTQFQTTAAYGFCLTISAAVTGGGMVTYTKY
jgi:hypothetical protein